MALAFDAASSSSGTDVNSLTWSHVCTGADLLLTVGVDIFNLYNDAGIPEVGGITYNGVALTKIDAQAAGTYCRSELWYLIAPAAGTHDIIVTFTWTPAPGVVGGARSFTGADQSAPLGTSAKATGTTTPATVTIASAAGQYVVDSACAYKATAITMTVGAGQTEDWNATPATGSVGVGSYEGGAASVTMSWTLSATASGWATVAVPIKPATAPGATATTASEVWVIPSRTEPLAITAGYTGFLARSLSTLYPHLLAWKVVNGRFIWHDLGPLFALAPLEAIAAGSVPIGQGVDPGLVLFGVEAHNGVMLTSLGSSALGASQRRFPDPGGLYTIDSGLLFGSRVEFTEPQKITALRIWGENFQQADTVRFAYRWDRGRWQGVGEMHGLPDEVPVNDSEGGLYLEWLVGFTDKNAWEPSLPVITRLDVQTEPMTKALRPAPDRTVPEIE